MRQQAGGADRLEVVRDLGHGGLTPDLALVRAIAEAVDIPLRVMVRENPSMQLANAAELGMFFASQAAEFNALGLDGLVAGFIANDEVDLAAVRAIAEAAPQMNITFHRAFDAAFRPAKSHPHAQDSAASRPNIDNRRPVRFVARPQAPSSILAALRGS